MKDWNNEMIASIGGWTDEDELKKHYGERNNYYCYLCKQRHRTNSKIGIKHLNHMRNIIVRGRY